MSGSAMPAGTAPAPGGVLSNRQLNRSLLARQLLLERQPLPAANVIEHLAGMQSQAPRDPFIGLWSRIDGFRHEDLDQLMLDRQAVRIVAMRGTIHLLTRGDAALLRPMTQTTLERFVESNATYARDIDGLDLDAVAATGRQFLEATPATARQLGAALVASWPGRNPASLSQVVRSFLPLVQVTPRGMWGQSQQPTLTTFEEWTGETMERYCDPGEGILRYLAAFGPATVADVQAWFGLPALRSHVERLRPQLVTYRDDRNRELVDVAGAPFPDPGTPAPVRFLPGFDNALLAHADRTRIVSDGHRRRMWKKNGLIDPSFLIDGYVAGTWKASEGKDGVHLDVMPLDTALPEGVHEEVLCEGQRLLSFLAPAAGHREIVVHDPIRN
jgi:hypothetical protein